MFPKRPVKRQQGPEDSSAQTNKQEADFIHSQQTEANANIMRKGHAQAQAHLQDQATPNTLICVIQAALRGRPSVLREGVLPRLQRRRGPDRPGLPARLLRQEVQGPRRAHSDWMECEGNPKAPPKGSRESQQRFAG